MKNRNFTLLAFSVFAFPLFFACSKKDNKPAKTKTDLLVQLNWKYDNSGFDTDKNGTIDQNDPQDACITDNIYTFHSDGTGVADEGATKCDPNDPQTVSFTWELKTNDTILNAGDLSDNTDATILSLDDNHLVVYEDIDLGGGVVLRYISIFKH